MVQGVAVPVAELLEQGTAAAAKQYAAATFLNPLSVISFRNASASVLRDRLSAVAYGGFEDQELKVFDIVMDRYTPLAIMILGHHRITSTGLSV